MRRKKIHCAISSPSLEPAVPYVILSSQRLQLRDKPPPRAARAESERLREALSRKAPVIGFRSALERWTSAPRVLCGRSACPLFPVFFRSRDPWRELWRLPNGRSAPASCLSSPSFFPPRLRFLSGPLQPAGRGRCQGRSHDNMGEGRADFGCRKASSFTSRT